MSAKYRVELPGRSMSVFYYISWYLFCLDTSKSHLWVKNQFVAVVFENVGWKTLVLSFLVNSLISTWIQSHCTKAAYAAKIEGR